VKNVKFLSERIKNSSNNNEQSLHKPTFSVSFNSVLQYSHQEQVIGSIKICIENISDKRVTLHADFHTVHRYSVPEEFEVCRKAANKKRTRLAALRHKAADI